MEEKTDTGGKNGRILFVDDEEYLVDMGQEMLVDHGFEVTATTRAPDALTMVDADPRQFDLLITDYTMPEMTGDQLIQGVWKIRPELPVILCTGIYLPEEVQARTKGAVMLMKPFGMQSLIDTVRSILGTTG